MARPQGANVVFRYEVAHSDEALPVIERALHSLSEEEVQREYEQIDTPFRVFFDQKPAVDASHSWQRGDDSIEISLTGPATQVAADNLVAEFLVWWNNMHKGLAVVLRRRLGSAPHSE